mgnify:FL=1
MLILCPSVVALVTLTAGMIILKMLFVVLQAYVAQGTLQFAKPLSDIKEVKETSLMVKQINCYI